MLMRDARKASTGAVGEKRSKRAPSGMSKSLKPGAFHSVIFAAVLGLKAICFGE